MKIIQLVQKPQRRGAEIFSSQLSDALRTKRNAVCTFYLYPYSGQKSLRLNKNDQLLNGNERHFFEKAPGVHPVLLRSLRRSIDDWQPDIVQVNGARTIKYAVFAKKLSPKPSWKIVYRNIDNPAYWVKDPWRKFFYRRLVMPGVDGIIGVSRKTLDAVKKLYHIDKPSKFIPNGVDAEPLLAAPSQKSVREQMHILQHHAVLLFIGSLTTQKRPDRFVRVVHSIRHKHPNIKALVLGDGPLRSEMENMASRVGLDGAIRFCGYQSDVAPWLSAADVLLVTSDSDGIPAVVLEAGFLKTPTVATRVGGLPECVVDGKTGFLAEPTQEDKLAEAVVTLLRSESLRQQMGEAALTWVRENFEIGVVARQYLSFYASVLDEPKRRAVYV